MKHDKHFKEQKQLDPIVPEEATHPISVQCPERWFQFLLNWEKQQFVSGTSNFLEQMYDSQKRTMFLQKRISNLQDLPRSQNLEIVPVCIVWPYYPQNNIVCIHKYDEYLKTNDSGVCHRPWSILWWMDQAYLLTIEYQFVQFVPSTNITEQCESIHVTILPTDYISSSLKWWSSMHGVDTL